MNYFFYVPILCDSVFNTLSDPTQNSYIFGIYLLYFNETKKKVTSSPQPP